MDEQKQDDQLEPIYNNSVLIQDIALKTSRERWTIETGNERGSGKSVLSAWHNDDDDIYDISPIYIEIIFISTMYLCYISNIFKLSLYLQYIYTIYNNTSLNKSRAW